MNDTIVEDLSGPESLNSFEVVFVATLSILIAIANVLMGCEVSFTPANPYKDLFSA